MSESLRSFEDFVLGPANLLAATAARRVAEYPGGVYNPLIIRGERGVGKTHLLQALARAATELEPDLTIRLDTGGQLVERFTGGLGAGNMAAVRNTFAGIDLLLIDDVEQLVDLAATQRELTAILSAMLDNRRQIVVTTAVAPMRLAGLLPELQGLLARGLLVDLDVPDDATRRSIVSAFARRRRAPLNPALIETLIEAGPPDLGKLDLAVGRLVSLADDLARPLVPGDVHRVLDDSPAGSRKSMEFGAFLDDVSRALAAVVEEAPWRRRIAAAILHWESRGIRTNRLDDALEADTPPDVESLIEAFGRDAQRLLDIRAQLGSRADEERLFDPSDLPRAEQLLRLADDHARDREAPLAPGTADAADDVVTVDRLFLDTRRMVLTYADLEGRLIEESG